MKRAPNARWTRIFGLAGLLTLLRRVRRRADAKELAIESREQLFSMLVRNADDIYVMFSPDAYEVEYVSPNVEKLLGVSVEAVKNNIRALSDSAADPSSDPRIDDIASLEEGECLQVFRERIQARTGERRWYQETLYRESIKGVDKYVLVLSDRTNEQKGSLMLEQALDIARSSNEAKSQFLANMSHDIRTPINAIVGMTKIARESGEASEKIAGCLDAITASSRHLLELINDVLDMSRIESGKVSIINEEFDFRSFVEGISSLIYPQAKNKNIVFDLNIEGVVDERYRGDPLRLNQVLINILSNALKFTPEWRSVHLSIRETRRVRDRAYLQFIVRDTGIGMEKGLLERIFEPFEQGGASISHSYGGSGLGLAISSNLISLMNGHISVSSTPGVGSEFVVELPLLTVPDNTPKQDVSLEDIRVLVVDDDLVTCEHTTLILNRIGVDAEYVTSGKAAVTRVKSALQRHTCYNIALVDWKMPDMDGVETARSIRRIVGPDTLVIIMSAYDWTEIEARAREAGVDFFISKPIFQSVVQDVLLKATRRRQSADTLPVQKEDFAGRRILLVEDNEINMEIARTLLEFRNASVDGACNGQQAVEMFRSSPQNHYDAVLMDVRMPVMDGIAATQAIRGLDRADAATVPILAMTANAFAEDIERSRKAGMNEHLAKPIEPETLYARLASYFR